jgi:PAS domain S-box-containing protein
MIDTPPQGTPKDVSPNASSQGDTPEGLYRLLVESVQDYAIFALDRTGRVLTWSAGAARLKGYSRTEIIGRHFSAFYPPEDVAAGKPDQELEEATRTGRLEDQGWRVRKDGTRFWANVIITALYDELGALVGFAKVTRDRTEQRRETEALRESEARFRLLVESVRDYAIFLLDPQGYVATWNAGAERIKGYDASEIVGRHFSAFYPEAKIADGFPQYELEVAARDGRFEDEGWRIRKDGSRFWANVVITALHNPAGELVGFAKVTRDLTERRAAEEQARRLAAEQAARTEAERRGEELRVLSEQLQNQAIQLEQQTEEAQSLSEELEQTNDELERALADATEARRAAEAAATRAEAANRAKSEFLSTMSHELRTPLNAIGGYAQLLTMGVRGPLAESQQQDLQRIERASQHLMGLVTDVLNFARLDAGQIEFHLADVEVGSVIADLESLIGPQIEAKGLSFDHDACAPDTPDQPHMVRADPEKLRQILLNLLTNAVKFTDRGGRVSLACETDTAAGVVRIQVTDTGRGIPPDQLERIFEPFVQIDRHRTHESQQGVGLGLSISRDLARGMKGDLTVASVEGRGSTFTLTLRAGGTTPS